MLCTSVKTIIFSVCLLLHCCFCPLSGMGDEYKINTDALPRVREQVRAQHFECLYNVLSSFPPELVNLVLQYHEPIIPEKYGRNQKSRPECLRKVRAHMSPVECVLPLNQGGCATAAYHDPNVKVWDQSLDLKKVLVTGMSQINCLLQLRDGSLMVGGATHARGTDKKAIQTWNLESHKSVDRVRDQEGQILCLDTVHNAKNEEMVAFGADDGRIAVSDPKTFETKILHRQESAICSLAELSQGYLVSLLRDGKIRVWDWVNNKKICDINLDDGISYDLRGVYDWSVLNRCLFAYGDSMIGFSTSMSLEQEDFQKRFHLSVAHVDVKRGKATSFEVMEMRLPCEMVSIKKVSGDSGIMLLTDGTTVLFDVDAKNDCKLVNHWPLGKITTIASLKRPLRWLVAGNKQGELLLWR